MKCYDQHVHSAFSFDSQAQLTDECAAAAAAGLAGLTFTEHFSVDPLDVSYGVLDYPAYRQAISACQDAYAGQLDIGCGLEIGEPHLEKCRTSLAEARRGMQLDFVIGSVHNIGSIKLRNFQKGKRKEEIYDAYFQEILEMVQTADIDVVGHLDLAKRYAFDVVGTYDFTRYEAQIAKILETIIKRGLGIEINTSGWRNAVGICYPAPEVVQLYHDLGGKYITIGSDAHRLEDIASNWQQAITVLKDSGFHAYCYYRERTPQLIPINA